MLVMFSGICYRTQENKISFILQYTCIDRNEAGFKLDISYDLTLTLMGKLLFVFT